MALMLALASALYFWLGDRHEGIILAIALFPVLGVDVLMEARSRKALKKLASAVAPTASVIRSGARLEVPSVEIVPGDLLVIREGDVLHADGVVTFAANLTVDESQLTGESEPREKIADNGEQSRFYAGSLVIAGHGFGRVTATGQSTRFGEIARLIAEADTTTTPLQRETSKIARYLVLIAIVLAVCIFLVLVARNAPPSRAFLYAVSLAMSAVSEEFVLVFSLFLSLGAWRLGKIGVLVRRLATVETLGSTTVICIDKTGTLTAGSYALSSHQTLRPEVSENELLEAAVLACEKNPQDPIERAIIAHCSSHNVNPEELHSRWSLVRDYDFDPRGKHMSHVWASIDDSRAEARIVAKGAIEGVLEHCRLTPEEHQQAHTANAKLAASGMRVLAVAGRVFVGSWVGKQPYCTRLADGRNDTRQLLERDLELYGLLAFHDPLRTEVPQAVAECQSAGIRLKMITGDHALTAHAIAEAAGIVHRDDLIFSGPELAKMDQEHFEQAAREAAIFARVTPDQKYSIVDMLIRAGEVVAMTGDGINDAPALRRAHIGVAMGQRGTEAARAAAALVLLRDDFRALVATVREGRRVYSNIQRTFRYLISFKFMLVGLALLAPLSGIPLLLLPVNLVWLELIVHPVSALAFEGDPGPEDIMRRPPRDSAASIIALDAMLSPALSGAMLTVGAFLLFVTHLEDGEAYARGIAIALVIVGSLFLVWAEFAGARPWWRSLLPRSLRFWAVCVGALASLMAAMWIPKLAALVQIAPISAADWGVLIGISLASVIWRPLGFKK
jgi:Ca2+-transporting ATPase